MALDAVIVFVEVCAILALAVAVLWGIAKLAGYVAMVFEGEPLVDGVKRDMTMTRRQLRRTLRRGGVRTPRPTV